MKIQIAFYLFVILATSCGMESRNNEEKSTQNIVKNHPLHKLISDKFTVAYLDFYQDELSRIFIVITPNRVNDIELISETVCSVEEFYLVTDHTHLSFFSEMRYAAYKDSLFVNENHPLDLSEYEEWQESYYLSEFDFNDRSYRTFPSSMDIKKQKVHEIEICL